MVRPQPTSPGNRELMGRLPGSETDMRAETFPPEAGPSSARLKQPGAILSAPPEGGHAPPKGSRMKGVATEKAPTADTVPGAMLNSCDLFPEIPSCSRVSVEPPHYPRDFQRYYFLPASHEPAEQAPPTLPSTAGVVRCPGGAPGLSRAPEESPW